MMAHISPQASVPAHTPGPWETTYRRRPDPTWVVSNPQTGVTVGTAWHETDARLIVAAPDLLDSLRTLVEVEDGEALGLDFRLKLRRALADARAAIAKATEARP